jgi:putative hydrolase of the HAD superfamily
MYTHVFFDLDRTLWDFASNSKKTLTELIHKYQLPEKGIGSADLFIEEYLKINEQLWEQYGRNIIDKDTLRFQRFHQTLLKYGIDDPNISEGIGNDYVSMSADRTDLFPGAVEVLTYLREKYSLHIITNGFEEVQHVKLQKSGIDVYFSSVITSEMAGYKKPDPGIFEFSFRHAGCDPGKSIMIGDSMEADIKGARNVGMHQIFFNPDGKDHNEDVTHEIRELKELIGIL